MCDSSVQDVHSTHTRDCSRTKCHVKDLGTHVSPQRYFERYDQRTMRPTLVTKTLRENVTMRIFEKKNYENYEN